MRSFCRMCAVAALMGIAAPHPPKLAHAGQQYAAAGSQLLSIDAATGNVTVLNPNVGVSLKALALDPTSGLLYGYATVTGAEEFFTINPSTGSTTLINPDIGPGIGSMDFSSTGVLYASVRGGFVELDTINKATGALTLINSNVGTDMAGLAFDNTGTLWGVSGPANGGPIFAVDTSNGDLSFLTGNSPGIGRDSLTYDSGTDKLFGVFGTSWRSISRVDGSLTTIKADLGYTITALAQGGASLVAGDFNHDGLVNLTDYGILKGHWLQAGATLSTGDMNGDATVDITDFALFKQAYQAHNGGGAGGLTAVPEPSTLLTATVAAPFVVVIMFVCHSKRKRR